MSSATVIGIGVGGPRKGFHAVALSEILVAFQGIDEILLAPVHLRCSYGAGDLRFGERFRDMVRMDGPNSICLDFSRFCSASTPLADWRQSSWPVRGTDRPPVVAGDNRGAMALEATRKLSHPSLRAITSTGFL